MKLSEAIRIAEKIRPWLDRRTEWRIALDALVDAARTQVNDPEVPTPKREPSMLDRIAGEVGKAWDEFAGSLVDVPCAAEDPTPAPEPTREPVEIVDADGVRKLPDGAIYVACSSTGVPERSPRTRMVENATNADPVPADWTYYRVLYRPDGWAVPKPAAPKVGDEVPDREAVRKLPHGTLIKDQTGMRGLVSPSSHGTTVVRWTNPRPLPEYPVVIVDVNVP